MVRWPRVQLLSGEHHISDCGRTPASRRFKGERQTPDVAFAALSYRSRHKSQENCNEVFGLSAVWGKSILFSWYIKNYNHVTISISIRRNYQALFSSTEIRTNARIFFRPNSNKFHMKGHSWIFLLLVARNISVLSLKLNESIFSVRKSRKVRCCWLPINILYFWTSLIFTFLQKLLYKRLAFILHCHRSVSFISESAFSVSIYSFKNRMSALLIFPP